MARNPAAAKSFIDIHTQLHRAAVGAARKKTLETEPAAHAAIDFSYPERVTIRRVFAQPITAACHCDRLELCG